VRLGGLVRRGGAGADACACCDDGGRRAEAGEGDPAEEEAAEVVDGDPASVLSRNFWRLLREERWGLLGRRRGG